MNSAGSSSDTIGLAVDAYIRNKLPYKYNLLVSLVGEWVLRWRKRLRNTS